MSYEDAVRVADLKIRRSRFERIAADVGCRNNQLMELDDFFHPRVEEVADVLPVALGSLLSSSKLFHRMVEGGRVVRTTSMRGFIQLYAVSQLRRWRRSSLRFGEEQRRLKTWLGSIQSIVSSDYELAIAISECQQLIKGYGDTHRRGSANYDAILSSIERVRLRNNGATVLRELIHAALADEHGQALGRMLQDI
jgi:indolepyruvate ferredoxin oxidoreductase beta subunit